jgi:hypothetical protein
MSDSKASIRHEPHLERSGDAAAIHQEARNLSGWSATCYSRRVDSERYIRVSEIGTFVYCQRAWHLARQGAVSTLEAERSRGTEFHRQHGEETMRAAAAARLPAHIFGITAVILFLIGLALWLL